MEFVPSDVVFSAQKLNDLQRSRIRIETHGATSANPGSVITITLPEASVDLNSLTLRCVGTTSGGSGGTTNEQVYGRFPDDAATLFQSVEVRIGGQVVQSASTEFYSVAKVLKLANENLGKDNTSNSILSHSKIVNTGTGDNAEESVAMAIPLGGLCGFLGDAATRVLPLHHMGEMTIRIQLSPVSVLGLKAHGSLPGVWSDTGGSATSQGNNQRTNALSVTYKLEELYATVDTVSFSPMYDAMLADRIARENFLAIPYKAYTVFLHQGIKSNPASDTVRCQLSAGSIDRAYAALRNGIYLEKGTASRAFTYAANGSGGYGSPATFFESFNSTNNSNYAKLGNFKYHWTVSGVRMPSNGGNILDAAFDIVYGQHKVGTDSKGVMMFTLPDYNVGKCVIPLILDHPVMSKHQAGGYDSRGANTAINFTFEGAAQVTAADQAKKAEISAIVVLQSTQELRVSSGKQMAIAY